MTDQKTALIIGAGPAGLTAAYELLDKTDIEPVIFEATGDIGGISKTVEYKGNRIDIGGHRFFSKSDVVMDWWRNILPLQGAPSRDDLALGRKVPLVSQATIRELRTHKTRTITELDPEKTDYVMLVRRRISRILFNRRFFDYPISLSVRTLRNLGAWRTLKIGWSYLKMRLSPPRAEKTLEDFFINRFGEELYATFFRDYTEKVWGVPCRAIKPEWGAQRVKGLSIGKAILHALKRLWPRRDSLRQKDVETSLIEQFMYPKLGPGQLWETVAALVTSHGGEIHLHHKVIGVLVDGTRVTGLRVQNQQTGETFEVSGEYIFSSMPVRELIAALNVRPPEAVRQVAQGLIYRDFITVGLLLRKLAVQNKTATRTRTPLIPDNWIYVQEPDVRLGRIQIFNNWSPYLVRDPRTVWLGLEYFCNEGDDLWTLDDEAMAAFAISELAKIDFIEPQDVLDHIVLRVPKAYPAYFGTYDQFDVIREYTDQFVNLFLIGRNGMHRYNNADHSMLAAMVAVQNIVAGVSSKENIWRVNTEAEYHEERS